jgi:ubiquinone/menaquinone biosynthesis C-methylase UbiE
MPSLVRTAFLSSALAIAVLSGCKQETRPQPKKTASAAAPVASAEAPPIDCPLHNAQAHGPNHKPFEDPEKYIAFLDRPDREQWQKPDAIVQALGLVGDETVVDLGAGSGYFAFRFARVLPRGSVVASDVAPEMVRHIHHRAMSEGVKNVQAVLGEEADPKIPAGAKWIFICDVLHHVSDRPAWLSKLHAEASAGARLAIVEFKEGDLPMGPPASMKLAKSEVVSSVTGAGFAYLDDNAVELPYQYMVRFEKRIGK